MAALIGLLWLFKLRNRKKLAALVRASSRLAKGEKITLPVWQNDDWNTLAAMINHTAQTLQNKIHKADKEKEKLATVLVHMKEGVIGVDRDFQILIYNPSAGKILGFPDFAAGKSILECTRNPEIDEMIREAVNGETNVVRTIELSYPGKKFVRVNTAGIGGSETGICGLVVLNDITEIRNLENLRQEFVANVSHELRTPLTSIKGFVETLLSGALGDAAQSEKFLKIIQEDADRLGRLIDDLLDLSLMESRNAALKFENLSPKEEITKVLAAMEPAFARKKIRVDTHFEKNLPDVKADRDRLKQVLVNLLDNAVKFNHESGNILIEVKNRSSRVEISIQDTGTGIPARDLPRIFERFYRVDKARSKDSGGTGLGLSIVKHILEAHGGTIDCKSTPGKGSLFTISLPVTDSGATSR